jgi:hypothetical protein
MKSAKDARIFTLTLDEYKELEEIDNLITKATQKNERLIIVKEFSTNLIWDILKLDCGYFFRVNEQGVQISW